MNERIPLPKVLLVDDQVENLIALEALLQDLPIQILTARSGNEALALVLENDCAVVLLDVKMPVLDGFETAALIRGNRRTSHTPLIFVTASREEEALFRGYDVGGVDYLFKPLVPAIVRSKVCVFVDLYRQRQLLESLTARLELSNADLLEAKEAAEKANQAKSEFLAIVTHEIRNPLAALIGYSEMLANYAKDEESRSKYVRKIHTISKNMTTLMNDLLDLSKVDAGKLTVEHLRFSPVNSVREVLSMFEPTAEEKNLRLELVLEEPLPDSIESDPMRFRQILTNLVANAIKFTDAGSVSLRVRFREATADHPARIEVWVRDTGIGIAESRQAALFQPFVQASKSTSREYGGSGLGLCLSRKFARALGGDVFLVGSSTSLGSEFLASIEAREPSFPAVAGSLCPSSPQSIAEEGTHHR